MTYTEPVTLLEKLAQRAASDNPAPEPLTHRIPVAHYTDSARFLQEQALFLRTPVIIGHETQIPEPGDSLVYDWLGLPLITMRDNAGNIASFKNVCRHRGMRLVQDEGKTCVRSLVCPYHQWTYGLDGALRNIPRQESFSEIDPQQLGLIQVPTAIRGGLIWVQAEGDVNGLDIDNHLAGLENDLDIFAMPAFQFCEQNVRAFPCNWKLIQDAFLDGYHVTRLHKNTVGAFFPDAISESDNLGLHIRSAVARNEIFDTAGLGKNELKLRHHATYSYTIFPNSVLVFHPDYTSILSLFPTSADETIFAHTMLTPNPPTSDEERDHFRRSFELIDKGVFEAEDVFVSVGAQMGMRSGANDALIFGGLEEAAIRFHQQLDEAL